MLNRTIQVKVVKPNKPDGEPVDDKEYLDRLGMIADFAEGLIWDAAKLAAGYMILDTFRKSVILKSARTCCNCVVASQKIQGL